MRPAFLDSLSWEMAEVYGAITDQILINLAHYFPYYDSRNFPRSAITYQADMLAQMGQVNKDTMRIIRRNLAGASPALKKCLEQVVIDSVRAVNPELVDAVKAGILKPAGLPIVAPNQMRAFNLYYTQAADKLNLVNTVMLESTAQAYQATVADVAARVQATQTAIDVGAGEAITGVSSWNDATRHAIDRMKVNGITGFIDHAGRHWSAEAYVAMDVRTTLYNTGRAAVWETNENFGNDLYIVSYHNGARPLCYPWQLKVISSMDNARVVADLDGNEVQVYAQSATSYGQPAGLFGINCKHRPDPFIPGVSTIHGQVQSKEENDKEYAESQHQRALERKLREQRRDVLMEKARGAPQETIDKLEAKCKDTSREIQDFCDDTGRRRHREREAVYTKREFPAADTYDVTEFKHEQQEQIKQYFAGGGAQQAFPFTAGMIPNEPIPIKPSTASVQPQTPDTTVYGKPFDDSGYRKPQQAQLADAKATLKAAPENARAVWSECADKFERPSFGAPGVDGAHYSRAMRRTRYKTYKEAFAESTYQRKNVVWFHEYGHNIDNILGGFGMTDDAYFSVQYKGGLFGKTIDKECEAAVRKFYLHKHGLKDAFDAVKAAQDSPGGMGFHSFVRQALKQTVAHDEYWSLLDMMADSGYADDVVRQVVGTHLQPLFDQELAAMVHSKATGKDFIAWVKNTYTIYERTDISDIFERYTVTHYGETYPFGVGHGKSYALKAGATEKEAFAEMYSALVTQNESLGVIKDFFPESWALFEEMLGSVI